MTRYRTLFGITLTAFSAIALLVACVTRVPVDSQFKPESADYEVIVSLPFVTNRKLDPVANGGEYYGFALGEVSAGHCRVGFEEYDGKNKILRVDTAPIEAVIPAPAADSFVIYVHGYGESFARNCRRASLLQHRVGLEGRLLLFSWPSGHYLDYAQDAADLEASLDALNELISRIAASIGPENLVLMAHSMGSRGVVNALISRTDDHPRLKSLVLVAPDVQRDVFRENVQLLQEKVSNITVYNSDKDLALWLSTTVNASGRLGVAKEFPLDVQHVSVVDVTPTGNSDISGHLYHLHNPAVIEDLPDLLGVKPPNAKREFHRAAANTDGFWTLQSATMAD